VYTAVIVYSAKMRLHCTAAQPPLQPSPDEGSQVHTRPMTLLPKGNRPVAASRACTLLSVVQNKQASRVLHKGTKHRELACSLSPT